MSILEAIKGDRRLSMNHWRYRLLHWCFSTEAPSTFEVENSLCHLPRALYTHYCPLFHLTNLIAICSPVIFLIKVLIASVRVISGLAFWAVSNFCWKDFVSLIPAKPIVKDITYERSLFIGFLPSLSDFNDFEYFWYCKGDLFDILKKEEAKALFDEYGATITALREEEKLRKKKRRERMTFWVNFSRVFFKCGLNIFYMALALLLIAVPLYYIKEIWWFICLMISAIFSWTTLLFGILPVIAIVAIIYLHTLKPVQNTSLKTLGFLLGLMPPMHFLDRFWKWLRRCGRGFCEFLSVFYEDNCPAIILITPEQAEVEAKIEDDYE